MWVDLLVEYGLFLLKALTIVFVIGLIFSIIGGGVMQMRENRTQKFVIKPLHQQRFEQVSYFHRLLGNKKIVKTLQKQYDKLWKPGSDLLNSGRLFVVEFSGNLQANAVATLSQQINFLCQVFQQGDQVLLKLESPGGVVHGYGLGAVELIRLKKRGFFLTVAVDKVAASGGYMMACTADTIVASPFAYVGSIGVVLQTPNLAKVLKKLDIDFIQITAGKHKRDLSLFAPITKQGKDKATENVQHIYNQFVDFVQSQRVQLDIEQVATGEVWLGKQAKEKGLVDELQTSEEFIQNWLNQDKAAFVITEQKSAGQRLSTLLTRLGNGVENLFARV